MAYEFKPRHMILAARDEFEDWKYQPPRAPCPAPRRRPSQPPPSPPSHLLLELSRLPPSSPPPLPLPPPLSTLWPPQYTRLEGTFDIPFRPKNSSPHFTKLNFKANNKISVFQ